MSVAPALLGLEESGRYLGGLSIRTIRAFIESKELTPVKMPAGTAGARRVVLAREDLDALVARWRGRS